ncbi:hypothetical protein DICPUDRAFT_81950 [Dictyostelium purpureum]|uniref:Uncharacterized protein n=1 Tax=Dictyostelium purpureum TaxID=5786 RepID=F0ZV29_DICPU|nr:uncharacterized protein DICPUDRAFT_81950 [Dictyostelium purpureum]EGC32198.1 hypothetical protein DICPUDRAFT_81950 [Dictyostelium purpureum]|eukprot:XP_003291270.1 hypothetical protein DICPUDRAFT_81950 [Dictyostelium purpureum]
MSIVSNNSSNSFNYNLKFNSSNNCDTNNNYSNNNYNNNNEVESNGSGFFKINNNKDDSIELSSNIFQNFSHYNNYNIIVNTKEKYIIMKQFQGSQFSPYYPSELEKYINKDQFFKIIKKSNNINSKSYLFIIIHSINVAFIIALQAIIFFLLFYFKSPYEYFFTIIIPTILLFSFTYLINLIQKKTILYRINNIENYYKKLHVTYKELEFIPLIQQLNNRQYFFGNITIDIKEIEVEYPNEDYNNSEEKKTNQVIEESIIEIKNDENIKYKSNRNGNIEDVKKEVLENQNNSTTTTTTTTVVISSEQ